MSLQLKDECKIINQRLAGQLKNLRHDACMTMRQVAVKIGTAHSFVSKIEKQNRRMDVGEFAVYCRSLNRDPVEVLDQLLAADNAGHTK